MAQRFRGTALLLLVAACAVAGAAAGAVRSAAGAGSAGAVPAAPDLRTAAVVDLTHPFDDKTLYWPTSPSASGKYPVAA